MSTTIDDRIVMMKFDNKDFERNAQTSMSTLDLLKQKLNFSDVQSGIDSIDTSSLKKAFDNLGDIDSSKLESVLDRMEYRMSNMGIFVGRIVENVADSIYSIVEKALSGITSLVTFAENGIVSGGYSRASNIQSAKFQLEGLGIAWKDIVDDIDYAVKNTAYSLDQAALVSARLSSSGVKPGEMWVDASGNVRDVDTMAMILRSISGTAASTGGKAGYSEIGDIFTKMVSKGEVQKMELQELAYRGIGATGILAEYFNKVGYGGKTDWNENDIYDITKDKDRHLDPYLVIEAFYEKFGEHATAANETLTGVIANTKAALARIGENFFTPIIENGGPLVHLIEAVRQSLNDLNGAISPVVKLFGEDVAGVLEKISGRFLDKNVVYDEDGNIVYDNNGNIKYKYTLKDKGGIFSSWFEPWTEAKEWHQFDDSILSNIAPGGERGYWADTTVTRAQKMAENLRTILTSTGTVIFNFFDNINKAFQQVFPNYKGFADLLVRITTKLADITKKWAESDFLNPPVTWKDSGLYAIIRGILAAIDIVARFGKSFKIHILDPIFNKGKSLVSKSPIADWFVDLANKIWDFDQMLKNEEDFFGPFLENMKTKFGELRDKISGFFDDIKPRIKAFFDDVVNWWKPVKDIIFDPNVSLTDKWAQIKDYFTKNFELPGWSKAKDIFSSLKQDLTESIAAFNEFFGIGTKTETLTLTTAESGMTNTGMVISSSVNQMDESTKSMPSIAERISGFFGSLKTSIGGVDLSKVLTPLNVFMGIMLTLIILIIQAIHRLSKFVVLDIPKILTSLSSSLSKFLTELSNTLKAVQINMYVDSLKKLAVAVAILATVMVALAIVITIMESKGINPELAFTRAFLPIITIIVLLIGVLTAIAIAVNKLGLVTSVFASWRKGNPFAQLTSVVPTLTAFAAIITALVSGILVLAAACAIIGFIPWENLKRGLATLAILAAIVAGIPLLLTVILGIFNSIKTKRFNLKASDLAKQLGSIAAMITALAVGLTAMTVAVIILGLIDKADSSLLTNGMKRLTELSVMFAVVLGICTFIISRTTKGFGGTGWKNTAARLIGMSFMITAIASATLLMAAALMVVSKSIKSPNDLWGPLALLATMAFLFTFIPMMLANVFDAKDGGKNVTANRLKDQRQKAMITAGLVAVMAASAIAVSYSLERLAGYDPLSMGVAAASLIAIMGTSLYLIYKIAQQSKDIKPDKNGSLFKDLAIAIGVMAGGALAISIALSTLMIVMSATDRNWKDLAVIGAILLGFMALAGGIVLLANFLSTKFKIKTSAFSDNMKDFSLSVLLMSSALVPIAAALYLAARSQSILGNADAFIDAAFALTLIFAAIVLATSYLGQSDIIDSPKKLIYLASNLMLITGTLLVIAGALGVVLGVMKMTEASSLDILSVGFVLFGGIMALAFIINALSNLDKAKANAGLKPSKTVEQLIGISGVLVAVAGIVLAMGMAVSTIKNSGATQEDLKSIVEAIGSITIIAGLLAALGIIASKYQDNASNKSLLYMLGAFGTAVLGCVALGALLVYAANNSDPEKMKTAAISIAIIGGVALVITAALTAIGSAFGSEKVTGGLIAMSGFLIACVSLALIGLTLIEVAKIDWVSIKENMNTIKEVFIGLIVVMAALAVIGTIGAFTGGFGMAATLAAFGLTMASVGAMLIMAAEGFKIFVDTILNISENRYKFRRGVSGAMGGIVQGLIEGMKTFNSHLSDILKQVSALFDILFPWINEELNKRLHNIIGFIKTLLLGIVDLAKDEEVQQGLWDIIDAMLNFLDAHIEEFAERLVVILGKLTHGLWKGFMPDNIDDADDIVNGLATIGGAVVKGGAKVFDGVGKFFTSGFHEMIDFFGIDDTLGKFIADSLGITSDFDIYDIIAGMDLSDGLTGLGEHLVGLFTETSDLNAMNKQLAAWDTYYSEFEDVISRYVDTLNVSDVEKEFIKNSESVDNAIRLLVEAYGYGNQNYIDYIEEYGGAAKLMADAISGARSAFQPSMHAVYDPWGTIIGDYDEIDEAIFNINNTFNILKDSLENFGGFNIGFDLVSELLDGMKEAGGTDNENFFSFAHDGIQKIQDGLSEKETLKDINDTGIKTVQDYLTAIKDTLKLNKGLTNSQTYKIGKLAQKAFHLGQMAEEIENGAWHLQGTYNVYKGLYEKEFAELAEELAEDTGEDTATTFHDTAEDEIQNNPINASPTINVEDPTVETKSGETIGEFMAGAIVDDFYKNLEVSDGVAWAFTNIGRWSTEGIFKGMKQRLDEDTKDTANSFVKSFWNAFEINSPSKLFENEIGIWLVPGIMKGMEKTMPTAEKEAAQMGATLGGGIVKACENIYMNEAGETDFGAMFDALKQEAIKKLPSWDDYKDQFGWDKGISENYQAAKNMINSFISGWTDGSGSFNIESIFGDIPDKITSYLSSIMPGFDVSQFDVTGAMSFSAADVIDMESFGNEFSGYDVDDFMSNNTLHIDVEVDETKLEALQTKYDDYTMRTAGVIPRGYSASTTNSNTYVSNYTYNQNNTSTSPLNAREIRRQTDISLNRNRWRR